MFPIFDLKSYSELSETTDSGIFIFFKLSISFGFFLFDSAMFYDKSHNIISDIDSFVTFFYSVPFHLNCHSFQKFPSQPFCIF